MSTSAVQDNIITAEIVPDKRRLNTLPSHFGDACLEFEMMVFDVANRLSEDYRNGHGYWNFYNLSNGGFFMAPAYEDPLGVVVPFGNGFQGALGPEAFGVTVTLYAYCFLASKYTDGKFAEHYCKLKDYAATHAESDSIWWAID